MSDSKLGNTVETKIKILIVDDSIIFRKFLQETMKGLAGISICTVAKNGIEALDLVLKIQPDVILMDLEMPLMDGVTTLQHLMIHRPTPTIIFSSNVDEGSKEEVEVLKNGAVGFFSKADFFVNGRQDAFSARIRLAIIAASKTHVEHQPLSSQSSVVSTVKKETSMRLVFCEECGARNSVELEADLNSDTVSLCKECGDPLIIIEDMKAGAA